MYKFIDTNEASDGAVLLSEAFMINGEYIENLIPGYRTLIVSGREALSPELDSYETGIRDGSTIKSKRYPARTLTVKYQLLAENSNAFREAYNKLASILDVEDAQLIFNDENDKYFVGTPSLFRDVPSGRNAVVAEYEIFCADPFKYSTHEYEVEPITVEEKDEDGNVVTDDEGNVITGQMFEIEYNGTYKSYPRLEAKFYSENETSEDGETQTALTGDGDCGFVAFFNENGNIIQLGDPDESDGEDFEPSQTLVKQSFEAKTSWGTAAQGLWAVNSAVESVDPVVQVGTLNAAKSHSKAVDGEYYLKAKSYGSGSKWHGPSITRTIPADDTGVVGAENFTLTYAQKMHIGANDSTGQKQRGSFHVLLVSGSGDERKIVAGVNVQKGSTGKKANLRFYLNGAMVHAMDIDLSLYNPYFGKDKAATKKAAAVISVKTSTIRKVGDTVTFNIGGIVQSFTDPAIADMKVNEVTFMFGRYKTVAALSYNGLISAKFVKDNCTEWREVPNKFSTDDVIVADCQKGEVKLNNTLAPEYGALGNDWEEFYLQPGINQIGIAFSDWVAQGYEPTFKLRYREVFL